MKTLLHYGFALSMLAMFSCSAPKPYLFNFGHSNATNYHKKAPVAVADNKAVTEQAAPVLAAAQENASTAAAVTEVTKSAGVAKLKQAVAKINEQKEMEKAGIKYTRKAKMEDRKALKSAVREVAASDTKILAIIFAILIPPVGVAIYEGITNRFWISLLLTLLFFLPGMIYALLVVTDTI